MLGTPRRGDNANVPSRRLAKPLSRRAILEGPGNAITGQGTPTLSPHTAVSISVQDFSRVVCCFALICWSSTKPYSRLERGGFSQIFARSPREECWPKAMSRAWGWLTTFRTNNSQ